MANANSPRGLMPLGINLVGGCVRPNEYQKDAAEGSAIFTWDAVNREADGNIEAASATPGTTNFSGVSLNYGAASTLTKHLVVDDPSALFVCQGNGDGAIAEADMGLNVNLELNAGNSTSQLSGHVLDQSTMATTAGLDMKMHRLADDGLNVFGTYAMIIVSFNKHRMTPALAGV